MMSKNKVILFNPRAVSSTNFRIPNSILQVAASIEGLFDYVIVDGNRESDPASVINNYLKTGEFAYFGCTVMPGPQLSQAIPITEQLKKEYPEIKIIWGGYFAANQNDCVLNSNLVDFVINGPGDIAFPALLNALDHQLPFEFISNLIFKNEAGVLIKTNKQSLIDQDTLNKLPYNKLNTFYSIKGYLKKTHLGNETIAYHSSMGCPFNCSFCAVVPIYNARWRGKSAKIIYEDIKHIKEHYGGDAIEFHDNNFFVSEKRVAEFCRLMIDENMTWWGEGRIDTIDKYSDETLQLMQDAGCKMIFLGAESGNDNILKDIEKGGKQTGEQIKKFAKRLSTFNIIPEYSFVLGFPAESPEIVQQQIDEEIIFIRAVKEINPLTEIIIYLYSPVPTEGSELYKKITEAGFKFPTQLQDWLNPDWLQFDLRKNPLTPWLSPAMVDKIKNFEVVINAQYPTFTDPKVSSFQRSAMKLISSLRYKFGWYKFPYELKALQKYWLRYRRPETEGFAEANTINS